MSPGVGGWVGGSHTHGGTNDKSTGDTNKAFQYILKGFKRESGANTQIVYRTVQCYILFTV